MSDTDPEAATEKLKAEIEQGATDILKREAQLYEQGNSDPTAELQKYLQEVASSKGIPLEQLEDRLDKTRAGIERLVAIGDFIGEKPTPAIVKKAQEVKALIISEHGLTESLLDAGFAAFIARAEE